jgi:hypothetical protein
MPQFRGRKPRAASIPLDEIPRRALEIHAMRPDLRQTFDLADAAGREDLYWWYYLYGFREMLLPFEAADDLKGPVNSPVEHLAKRTPIPVTWLMREFWRRGAVATSIGDAEPPVGWRRWLPSRRTNTAEPISAADQWRLLSWYFLVGLDEHNLQGLLTEKQADQLLAGRRRLGPLILRFAHHLARDLHDQYPTAASAAWRDWCADAGQRRFPGLAHPLLRERLFGSAATERKQPRASRGDPGGVNLVGHAGARSGVGEDVRMAARALEEAGIPFVVRNVDPSSGAAPEEHGLDALMAHHSPNPVNIFCMAGMETVTAIAADRKLLEGKVNIGFWPWELPEWPRLWSHAPELMDEIWASTSFAADSYRRSTHVPVRQVPMAVEVNETAGCGRSDFNLPPDAFLFGYSFDGHSSFSRKNPKAVIEAFRLAFPGGDEPVGLVLKGLRVADHPAWRELEALAGADERISLISRSMSRGILLDLYRSLDCFVSLHRSEGFGRNIAECMLLGMPVIATDYSGNLDFTRPGTAALVPSEMVPVREGEYPFGQGQVWADPSTSHAADHMRRMLVDERWRNELAHSGQDFIRQHHSPKVVGAIFAGELKRIREQYLKG